MKVHIKIFDPFRSSFRDILRGVEEGDPPGEKVKFGQEVLHLDSWYKKLQYDWFCKVGSIHKQITMVKHKMRLLFARFWARA